MEEHFVSAFCFDFYTEILSDKKKQTENKKMVAITHIFKIKCHFILVYTSLQTVKLE